MSMMNGISNKILIVLAILIRYSSTMSSMENGTSNGMMFIGNDLQCLAQMPVGDLMKIRKAIRMMHAVSDYDAHHLPHLNALKIDNQNRNQTDSLLRELPDVADTHAAFRYFSRYSNSTNSPMAQRFMMTNQMHNDARNNQLMYIFNAIQTNFYRKLNALTFSLSLSLSPFSLTFVCITLVRVV